MYVDENQLNINPFTYHHLFVIWKFKAKIVAFNKVQVVANSIMQNFPWSSLLQEENKA